MKSVLLLPIFLSNLAVFTKPRAGTGLKKKTKRHRTEVLLSSGEKDQSLEKLMQLKRGGRKPERENWEKNY